MMLWADVVRNTDPPRVVRGIGDHFVPALLLLGRFSLELAWLGAHAEMCERCLRAVSC